MLNIGPQACEAAFKPFKVDLDVDCSEKRGHIGGARNHLRGNTVNREQTPHPPILQRHTWPCRFG